MSNLPDKPERGKPKTALAEVLRAQARANRVQADTLDAMAAAIEAEPADGDPLLQLPELKERYAVTREVLAAAVQRGELTVHKGPKGRIMVRQSAIEAWIESRSWTPRRTVKAAPTDLDAWEAQADRELQLVQGDKR